ncbi:sigma-70 family RNA polymerase sigma factor [Actinosynnema sp. NPDC020468]|uniref:RNA polymerase sigma factor n=1 Tax=Actinosynnema sp. NPDC020468 TaxID=3154488 RepID=UPI0033E24243
MPGGEHGRPARRAVEDRGTEDLLRELVPQVLGILVRRHGDFDAAEDAVQDAVLAAVRTWREVPEHPKAWLVKAATNALTDRLRSEHARRRREENAVAEPPPEVPDHDDTLTLLFLCCHPALTPPSAIALTLRAVGGLTTAEIANAFLVPETTMAQRISRAKQKVRTLEQPDPRSLRSVLHVLYLMFNEGYAGSVGPALNRVELSGEAIRLTRLVHVLRPDDPEVTGLLALMLLTDARRPARTGPHGELIPLADQDRARWDEALIVEGVALIEEALARGEIGEYQLQAAIAALHDDARTAEQTDWAQIDTMYALLERVTGNPVVTLNRAVAVAMTRGPAAGLALIDTLDDRLPGHHRLDSVRGHLHEMAGEKDRARTHYRAAAARTTSLPERHYLLGKAANLR